MKPRDIQYLTADDVIEAHAVAMNVLGLDPRPLRSRDLLEGAINRVPTRCNYESMTIPGMAALTALSISQAQAFMDGNKRTAYSSLILFCLFNGYEYVGKSMDLAVFLVVQANASEHSRFCKQFDHLHVHDDDPADVAFDAMSVWLSGSIVPISSRTGSFFSRTRRNRAAHARSEQLPLIERED